MSKTPIELYQTAAHQHTDKDLPPKPKVPGAKKAKAVSSKTWTHTHAWGKAKHRHGDEQCKRPECAGYEPHGIHVDGKGNYPEIEADLKKSLSDLKGQ